MMKGMREEKGELLCKGSETHEQREGWLELVRIPLMFMGRASTLQRPEVMIAFLLLQGKMTHFWTSVDKLHHVTKNLATKSIKRSAL